MKQPAPGDLQALATQAAVEPHVSAYLAAKKLTSVGVIAASCTEYPEVDDLLFKPFEQGVTIDGTEYKCPPEERMVVRACIRYLWRLCDDQVKQASAGTVLTAPAPPPTPPPASSSGKTAPKEIPPETLRLLIDHYENQMIHGERRQFPIKILLRRW